LQKDSISLNKYISNTGICSRREADKLIEAGRITINGKVAKKGNRVFPKDKVAYDGEPIGKKSKAIYLKYHKPDGITCTTDRSDKTNIVDQINIRQRIFPIGRLDKNSTGLILLTNDGDVVNEILRKENKHEKEYIVKVDKPITSQFLQKMAKPMHIMGKKTLPCKIKQLKTNVFKIILTQGLNRQIRRMCKACDYKVMSLKRIRIMQIKMSGLNPGEWTQLTDEERNQLFSKKR